MQDAPQEELIAKLTEMGLWDHRNGDHPHTNLELVDEYTYTGSDGKAIAIKGRFKTSEGKTFRWRMPESTEWTGLKGLKETDLPLFGAHHLRSAPMDATVFVCEGEKAVRACWVMKVIAVCPAGGASAKKFGSAFAVLEGRDVVLWPDNDDAGRELMRVLRASLESVAASVRVVTPALEEKADAFDYFQFHTKEDLFAELETVHDMPWCDISETGYLVSIPEVGGLVRFAFDDIGQRAHVLEADVTTYQEIPGVTQERFTARLNILSLSNRESYRRQLDEMYGKGIWTGLLSKACQMAHTAHRERDWSVDLEAVDVSMETVYAVPPFVIDRLPTIIFGPGGIGKTYFTLGMALAVMRGEPFLGRPTQKGAVLFVDYEGNETSTKKRLRKLGLQSFRDFVYWPARGRPFADMLPALRSKMAKKSVGLTIVDSAALACGDNPRDEQVANAYFNALAKLDCSSVTISHMTRDERDDVHPFGSIFWFNSARMVWNMKGSEEEENPRHLGLFNTKSNEDIKHRPIGVRIDFGDVVELSKEELSTDLSQHLSLPQRVRLALKPHAKSVKVLADETEADIDAVRRALHRMNDVRRVGDDPDGSALWGLAVS
jgi:hypothetical protein